MDTCVHGCCGIKVDKLGAFLSVGDHQVLILKEKRKKKRVTLKSEHFGFQSDMFLNLKRKLKF